MKKLFTIVLVFVLSLMVVGSAFAAGGTKKFNSAVLNYSSTGWGGWSCPKDYPLIVSGKVKKSTGGKPDFPIGEEHKWKPGAVTDGGVAYPSTPFGYTYSSGEEGYIVRNGRTPQNLIITLTCKKPSATVGVSLRCASPDGDGVCWQLIAGVKIEPPGSATLTFDGVSYTSSQSFHTNFGNHTWSAVASGGYFIYGSSGGSLKITRGECNEPGGPSIHIGTGPSGQPINLPLVILMGLIGVSALSAGAFAVKRSRL